MAESTDGFSIDRRTVLHGAGAVALTGIAVSSNGVAAEEHDDEEGNDGDDDDDSMLVLIYDDSPREDYTKVFPVHQEYDVPGCAAVCPGLMGTDSAWMHPGHLEEMYEAGWEVMGHTLQHRSLGEIPVLSDIETGDTEIHVQSSLHGMFAGDPLVIFNDETEIEVTADGRDDDGQPTLLLAEPVEEDIDVRGDHHTWVRYTDEFTEEIVSETKEIIEDEWGFGPVTAWVHTYNRHDGLVGELVPEYYDAVPNRHDGGLNPTFDPDPLGLSRRNFEDDSADDQELEAFLDTIANEPDFGILYGHSNLAAFTDDRIADTIEMAQERGIEIVTLQQALGRLDVLDIDDNGSRDPGGDDTGDDGVGGGDDDGFEGTSDDDGGLFDGIVGGLQSGMDSIRSAGSDFVSWVRGALPI